MNTNQLTFTRFIAALLIVILHFAGNLFYIENDFIITLRKHLYLGVDYFYVLSGFVMMIAYGDRDSINKKEYWINRVARVYPLHLFTLFLTFLISIFVSINYLTYYKFNVPSFLANLTLVQAWFPGYSLSWNVPSWSVSTEMFFYFVFPFVYHLFFRKLSVTKSTIIIFIIWLLFQIGMNVYYFSEQYGGYKSLDRYFLYYNPILHVSTFFVGMWFGNYFRKNNTKLNRNYDWHILILLILSSVLVYLASDLFIHNGLLAIPFALLILLVALNSGKLTQLFNHKWLIYLGEISFALYLLQNPVYIFLRKVFDGLGINKDGYLLFFVGLIVLLIASHFTYKYVEIPMKNRIRKINI